VRYGVDGCLGGRAGVGADDVGHVRDGERWAPFLRYASRCLYIGNLKDM